MSNDEQQDSQVAFDPFPRPGDANFTAFPKVAVEDTCVYQIYAVTDSTSPLSALQSILRKAKELEKQLLGKDYLWNRQGFNLKFEEILLQPASSSLQVASKNSSTATRSQWRLAGSTSHGDSIADEWAIVFLLRSLSTACPEAWIRIQDGDGEFLLVEAAHALPKWLEPDVAQNRVWLHDGKLLIVPSELEARKDAPTESEKQSQHKEAAQPIDLSQALEFIAKHGSPNSIEQEFVYSKSIEEEAFYKLRHYPSPAIEETFHTTRLLIPRVLAFIIRRCPELVSAAVEAFNQRDPLIMKPFFVASSSLAGTRGSDSKPLSFAVVDLVESSVRMTRVGYAQLVSQAFAVPPAYTGSGYDGLDKGPAQLGMKLTAGFEMILQRPVDENERVALRINTLLEDLECGDEKLPSDKEMASWSTRNDDDSWLNVSYEDFDNELNGRKARSRADGEENEGEQDFGDKAAQENLRHIVERFEKFLNDDDAGLDGAVFGDDESDSDADEKESDEHFEQLNNKTKSKDKTSHLDREQLDEEDDISDYDDEGEDRDASFDEQEFEQMMRQMMGMPADAPSASAPASASAFKSASASISKLKSTAEIKDDEPKVRTPHQFSFDDPNTTGAPREPTIRERIAALDLDADDKDSKDASWLTAKAFQHWAAESDVDFADSGDRASYLKKQGLPDLPEVSKPAKSSEPAVEKDTSFVSLSAHQTTVTRSSSSTLKPKPGATSQPRARDRHTGELQLQRLAELSDSDEEDDLLQVAQAGPGNTRRTAYASDDDEDEDDDAAWSALDAHLKSSSMADGGDREVLARNVLAALRQDKRGAGPAAAMAAALGVGRLPRHDSDGSDSESDAQQAEGKGKGKQRAS